MIGAAACGPVVGTWVVPSRGNLWGAALAPGKVGTVGIVAICTGALPT